MSSEKTVALAVCAHPDDIEFMMAGTLLLLKRAGVEIHMWNLLTGSCGTAHHTKEEIVRLRKQEAQDAAAVADAVIHAPIRDDLELFYDSETLRAVASVVREVRPTIVLTHSPQDYMEDHQNACRLTVSAVFARGMPNYAVTPPRAPYDAPVALYHALPHGRCDALRRPIASSHYVNIASVLPTKREMLARHRSQKEWLDVSQGMNVYLREMEAISRAVGKRSERFEVAEAWRLHLHLGYGPKDYDPLKSLLGDECWLDPAWPVEETTA
ncbi:MAG: PIG-L family deacetylase [Verrucomicrobiae bacterium]|nr:PIG-L family deacetylase [Verrucomicrobiae bacterium]